MRRSSVIFSTALTTVFIGAIWGCGDLFHSTDFSEVSKRDDKPINFCEWDQGTAALRAEHACTMLLSCQKGFAADAPNALGECMRRAIMAYDCQVAPNRPVKGKTRAFWDCLWRAKTCVAQDPTKENDVAECFKLDDGSSPPTGCQQRDTDYVTCEGPLRAQCRAHSPQAEFDPCVATGQTCAVLPGNKVVCAGSSNGACASPGCDTTRLHTCSDGGMPQDHGVDCANFGGEACMVASDAGPACKLSAPPLPDGGAPEPDASAGEACPPSGQVVCAGGTARGCPTGIWETVQCEHMGLACTTTPADVGDAFDVSRACGNRTAACPDDCDGEKLVACIRGAKLGAIDCANHGLGKCTKQQTADGKTQATCGPPLPRP
ncbi:hypothetical protein LZC95_24940 [Pendulispora brunnea]|uniref:Uncharacterized protein n=1 Tax=Pendulispora brunnea TaxID=2905690 RepID=A0ABZ2KNE9_9BACT